MKAFAARRALASTMLGLFLFGSNYCLVGVYAPDGTGALPACHASAAQAPSPSSCCQPARDASSPTEPASSSVSPCCMRATTAAPQAEKWIEAELSLAVLLPLAAAAASAPPATVLELRTDPPRPRARTLGPPSGNRAPPLPRA